MLNLKLIFVLLGLVFTTGYANAEVIHRQYSEYESWIDCNMRSVKLVKYIVKADYSDLSISKHFKFAPDIPEHCRQKSTGTYKVPGRASYHRGHQATFNQFDNSYQALKESNYMTPNILPQTAALNTGAMKSAEQFVECERDKYKWKKEEKDFGILVMDGPIYENGKTNTYFLKSHGIITPSHYFKIAIGGTENSIDSVHAWIMPNTDDAVATNVDNYLVTISDIEKVAGITFRIPEKYKHIKAKDSQPSTGHCSWSDWK